jgi:hypothetical protein
MTGILHPQPQLPDGLQPAALTSLDSPNKALGFSRDPHAIPLFDSQSLCEPQIPVLYLPPLLSALPEGLASHLVLSGKPPVVTETRLPDIDPASLSLHKALHHFTPVNSDYANTPYPEAFNWKELVLPEEDEREWYCVVFRSKRRVGSDGGCSSFPCIRLFPHLTSFFQRSMKLTNLHMKRQYGMEV